MSSTSAAPPVAFDSSEPPPPAAPKPWSGWHTLVVDFAGLAIGAAIGASVDSNVSGVGLASATWYGIGVVGAPAVHQAKGRWPVGLGDFAMRTLTPPLIGIAGLAAACVYNDDFDSSCASDGWAVGMLAGLVGAAAFDALILSDADVGTSPGPMGDWYGYQILIIDAVAYATGAYYAAREPREGRKRPHPGLALWVMDYIVGSIGAPIVHFSHSNVGFGFASLGIRLFIGPMGALVGLIGGCAGTAGAHKCAEEGAQWGLFGGSLTVALFDALVFGREAVDPKDKAKQSASSIDVMVGAGALGVHGSW